MGMCAHQTKAYHWVERDDDFEDCLNEWLDAEVLAIDTEGDNYYTYTPSICLIQIATPSDIYLVDTLSVSPQKIQLLAPILEDPYVTKVLHGADNDLAMFFNQYNIRINPLFDTIWAARFLNHPKRGLGDLLDRYFSVQTSKKFQRYDWRTRPLDPEAEDYAILDVDYLLELHCILREELEHKGRLDAAIEESEQLTLRDFTRKSFDPQGFRRIKGSKQLTPQQLGVLYALYMWRHERCLQTNRAAFLLLDNPALIELSRRQPKTMRELRTLRMVSHRQTRQMGTELLSVIRQGRHQSAPSRPRPSRKKRKTLTLKEQEAQAELYDQLREWRSQTSEKQEFEIDLVATNATLQSIAYERPQTPEELASIPGMLPWRCKRFTEQLLDITQRA